MYIANNICNNYGNVCHRKRKRAEEELNTIETAGSGSVSVELPALNSTHSLSQLMEKEDNDYDELPPLVPPKPAEQPAQKYAMREIWFIDLCMR